MFKKVCLFSGNANPELAAAIGQYLETPLGKCKVTRFSDGESFVEIGENVRGVDAFVIQSTSSPTNDNVMELLIMTDALRRASAGSITAVIPYYGYGRQDRKVAPRTPITSKLVADLVQISGVNRVVSVDLHAGQIQGFFNIPFDHLYAMPVFLEDYLKKRFDSSAVFVSPDAGGVERTRAYSKRLDASLAIIDKRRERANVSRGREPHRRGQGQGLHHHRRHHRHGRHAHRRRARPRREGGQEASSRARPTACSRGPPCSASPTRR